MILRSRRIPAVLPADRRRYGRAPPVAERETGEEDMASDCAPDSEDERVPTVSRRRFGVGARKRAATDEHAGDFLTPVRCRERLTKDGVTFPEDELVSPEHCVFSYNFFSRLAEEEDDDDEVFNPYHFIKNIPSQSQQSKPRTRDIPVKTRSTPQATLVLDLDETLVFSSLNMIENAEYTFHTYFQNHEYKVFVVLRPHVKEFLQSMSKIFEMFVYTSAKKEYAEKILETLDPQKKLFRHRLYQEDCACVRGHYVKDLDVLERDLARTVVLDNAPHAFPYHLMNMIPIKSWAGDREDKELQRLIPYLEKLSETEDFRQVLKRRTDHLHRLLSED
ncbi:hypothetical protein AAFF_G00257460 [Aldrovandia affinis]|uniref:FCP1 homology domain-containing protein n=1 Tax=Aldrovandia affinis TaxID=143900 RepID=A0AAD7ST29_9TELE|nr:hypothetical protein AAFF_G00257460 [Aldrovandia affinis]